MSEFYLLRHAESRPDPAIRDREWPLSSHGSAQALELVPLLKRIRVEAIYSSPFRRAIETVQPYTQATGIEIRTHDDLREQNTRLTGQEADYRQQIRRMWADFSTSPTGGELAAACQGRVIDAVRAIVGKNPDRVVLISSHANAIGYFLNHIDPTFGYEDWRMIGNAQLFRIVRMSEGRFIWDRGWNDASVIWKPGTQVLLREVLNGKVWAARPHTVVEDASELTVLWQAPGTRWMRPMSSDGQPVRPETRLRNDWRLVEDRWRFNTGTLRFIRPSRPYSVILFWNHDSYEQGAGAWYVNVEKPMHRTAYGFDHLDLLLDAVVAPNRASWQWKDEDEFAEAVGLGLVSPDEALTLRAAAQSAVDDILQTRPPYLDEWVHWRPPSDWNVPGLPDGWRRV